MTSYYFMRATHFLSELIGSCINAVQKISAWETPAEFTLKHLFKDQLRAPVVRFLWVRTKNATGAYDETC